MELMKVGEYSKAFDVSVQSVYQRLKKGTLKYEIKDNVKYVKVFDKPPVKEKLKNSKDNCKDIIKVYKQVVKDLRKQIKRLERDKDRNYSNLEKLFDKVLEVKSLSAPVLEAEIYETKKSKKKNKKKSKKKK